MRLISEGTVEENIFKVATEKLNLEKEVTSKDNGKISLCITLGVFSPEILAKWKWGVVKNTIHLT
jgi:hypothetical protein